MNALEAPPLKYVSVLSDNHDKWWCLLYITELTTQGSTSVFWGDCNTMSSARSPGIKILYYTQCIMHWLQFLCSHGLERWKWNSGGDGCFMGKINDTIILIFPGFSFFVLIRITKRWSFYNFAFSPLKNAVWISLVTVHYSSEILVPFIMLLYCTFCRQSLCST